MLNNPNPLIVLNQRILGSMLPAYCSHQINHGPAISENHESDFHKSMRERGERVLGDLTTRDIIRECVPAY